MIAVVPSPFEQFASDRGYDITPAVLPTENRVYADRQTQGAYETWLDGARHVASMLSDSTFNTEVFRAKMRKLAGNA
jgi:hypothetical protein